MFHEILDAIVLLMQNRVNCASVIGINQINGAPNEQWHFKKRLPVLGRG